jgi:threonyl-tRNA synthetase
MENDKLHDLRHSLAHLLAAAVLELYPNTKNTIGPSIEDGFYYDFDFTSPVSDKDLPKIEKKMKELLKSWKEFQSEEKTKEEAEKYFKNNEYKIELIDEIVGKGEKITFYICGDFIDLCRGGHLESPKKEIDPEAFKLDRVAGAYWRGDEKNKMLTRIYGLAFENKKDLEDYEKMREEAKKRDHKKLGKDLKLFTISELVGKGLPMILPRGNTIKTELENFIREKKESLGYFFVTIPHIARKELYIKSGHMGKYDAMMPIMKDENGDELVMKAMNCPHHFEIYNSESHTYKELPLRIAENTAVYRNEKSGELAGLLRVKNITQDDTHHFVMPNQIQSEIEMIFNLTKEVYETFGFNEYKVEISVRDHMNTDKYFGDDRVWEKAEKILIESAQKLGLKYSVEEGEAAFYGPKIDIKIKDSIGREWQLTTIQLDFNQSENFEMDYVGNDGKKHRVVVLHVAILGSLERFMGVLIEHYAGNFPVWLSPVQVAIVPVRENHNEKAREIFETLKKENIRAELFDYEDSLGKRIHNAKDIKTPFVIVLGDKEVASQKLTIENRDGSKTEGILFEEFLEKLKKEIAEKK